MFNMINKYLPMVAVGMSALHFVLYFGHPEVMGISVLSAAGWLSVAGRN